MSHAPFPKGSMQNVSHVTFENETVCLDDKHFQDCVLLRCILEYSGQELRIERTAFEGCRLKLSEGAGRTMQFLQCMGYMPEVSGDWESLAPLLN